MRDPQHLAANLDKIERISLALTGATAAGCRRSTLNDDDAMTVSAAWVSIQRTADVRTVEVAAKDKLDAQIRKEFHGSFRLRHCLVIFVVGSGRKVVMGG
jgi:hypothetical protein